jgi:hypothetical protein
MGNSAPDHSSRAWWMSEWHTPQNKISRTTSWGFGSRRSIVIGASALPAAAAPQAWIVCMRPSTLRRRAASTTEHPREATRDNAGVSRFVEPR